MKLLLFVLSFLALPSVFATSIAISPALIDVDSAETNSSFILINPNSYDINFSIKSTSNDIILEETTGLLEANSNRQISFQAINLKQDSYLIISLESENSISPALTLKLKKNYNETIEQAIIPKNQETKFPEITKPNTIEEPKKSNSLVYIMLAVFAVLIGLLLSGKYRTGRTGQIRRIFINKLS